MPNRPEWSGLKLLYGEEPPAIIRHSAVCLSFAESWAAEGLLLRSPRMHPALSVPAHTFCMFQTMASDHPAELIHRLEESAAPFQSDISGNSKRWRGSLWPLPQRYRIHRWFWHRPVSWQRASCGDWGLQLSQFSQRTNCQVISWITRKPLKKSLPC